MLNTEKLLYILPDLAYVADLLPGKKEYTFSTQSFRQINSEFIKDSSFIDEKIEKLFAKIDKSDHRIILPDFLFVITMVSVEEKSEEKALKEVEEKTLPKLNLSDDTHEIKIDILHNLKGVYRVQITAIEKGVLTPIVEAAKNNGVTIQEILPLSWTLKSIISLEPSISVVQAGSKLYCAQQYIGIDQTSYFDIEDVDKLAETIKTLKGSEPSIQTVYLASNSLVEKNLKDEIDKTIPIQQLSDSKDDDEKMPSYIKLLIESSMRTISIPDFSIPKFESLSTDKVSPDVSAKDEESDKVDVEENEVDEEKLEQDDKPLPKPEEAEFSEDEDDELENKMDEEVAEDDVEDVQEENKDNDQKETEEITTEVKKEVTPMPEEPTEAKTSKQDEETTEKKEETNPSVTPAEKEVESESRSESSINLAQFASKDSDNDIDDNTEEQVVTTDDSTPQVLDKSPKKVIKNSAGVGNMLKMVFITLAVFFITVAVGIGVGLTMIKISDRSSQEPEPTTITEEPEPTPEPEPEETEEVALEDLSVLVVNATTKAGYASQISTLLTNAGVGKVDAANASGDYEPGVYILMSEENTAIVEALSEATDFDLEYSNKVGVEDPNGNYDAVIVLAE
jgi:hypothetical protein